MRAERHLIDMYATDGAFDPGAVVNLVTDLDEAWASFLSRTFHAALIHALDAHLRFDSAPAASSLDSPRQGTHGIVTRTLSRSRTGGGRLRLLD